MAQFLKKRFELLIFESGCCSRLFLEKVCWYKGFSLLSFILRFPVFILLTMVFVSYGFLQSGWLRERSAGVGRKCIHQNIDNRRALELLMFKSGFQVVLQLVNICPKLSIEELLFRLFQADVVFVLLRKNCKATVVQPLLNTQQIYVVSQFYL